MSRPHPPAEVFDLSSPDFIPAGELKAWAFETFIRPGAALQNKDHEHLQSAELGFLWTVVANSRHMNPIAGQAERPMFQGGKWSKRRQELQMEQWFGLVPDFVITIDANYARQCDDASFCALIEHELYHCGQAKNDFGMPKFNKDGVPVFAMRGHDVEEFVGIVRRYGVGAAAGMTAQLVEAAGMSPEVEAARVKVACGSCNATL